MREQFRVLLLGTIVLQSSIFLSIGISAEDDSSSPQFIPRTDANAASDLKSLRFELSRIRDSAGNIDPLANYAKAPRAAENSTPPPSANPLELSPQTEASSPEESQPTAPATSKPTAPKIEDEKRRDSQQNPPSATNPTVPPRESSTPRRAPGNPGNSGNPSKPQNNRPSSTQNIHPATGSGNHQFRVLSPSDGVIPCGPRIVWESCVQLDAPVDTAQDRFVKAAENSSESKADTSTLATFASATLNIGQADDQLSTNADFSTPLQEMTIAKSQPTNRIVLSDGFTSIDSSFDPEAHKTPLLASNNAVVYASAHLPVSSSSDYIANFQEIPFGSQGTPTLPLPTFPTSPSLPTTPGVYPPGGNGVYPQVQTPPTYPAPNYIPPTTGSQAAIPTTPVYPPLNALPMDQGIPITQQPVQPLPTYAAPVLVAPAPYYVPAPVAATPIQTPLPTQTPSVSPLASNSGTQLPTYSLEDSRIVNFKPFVSGPPRQVDARRMVSPTLFRPAATASCNTPCGSGQPGYAPPVGSVPGASPMTYIPPVYMPYQPTASYAGYRSLVGFGQDISQAQIGRGIIGQPTAYIPNQPVRNFFRYIFP